jgi:hypothetical protein
MQKKFKCLIVDWNYAYDLCRDVSEQIKKAGFMPEVVVGVARGGWFLARVICDFLLLKDLISLKVEHWGITATITGEAGIKYGFGEAEKKRIKGKSVLIADDVTDTGDSLKLGIEYIKSSGEPKEIKTATLQHKTSSPFIPDFYGEEMKKDEWKWVIYPWSFHEDLMDIVERVLVQAKEKREMSLEGIRRCMKEDFDVYVPYHRMREVLHNMEYHGKIKRKGVGEGEGNEIWMKIAI